MIDLRALASPSADLAVGEARLLVTGAHGFLGRELLRQVHPSMVVHTASRHAADHGTTHVVDLLVPGSARALVAEVQPTHLVHLAWTTGPGYLDDPANTAWTEATTELVDAFGSAGGRQAVLLGSCIDGPPPANSQAPPPDRPWDTEYARAKAATSERCAALGARHGMAVAWARPTYLYGPGDRQGRLVGDACATLLAGHRFACGAPARRLDYLHVSDAAHALAVLLATGAEGVHDVGSGTAVVLGHLVRTIADIVGRPDLVDLADADVGAGEPAVVADDRRLRALGWSPRLDLVEGLRDTVEWWAAHGG